MQKYGDRLRTKVTKFISVKFFFSHFLSQAGVAVKARIWLVTASNAIQSDDLDGILHKPVGINAITEILYKKN